MLFSPNRGHTLVPEHPKPTLILNNGEKDAIVTAYHPSSPLIYDDVSLKSQIDNGISIPTMDCKDFFTPTLEQKFDTIKQLNDSVK